MEISKKYLTIVLISVTILVTDISFSQSFNFKQITNAFKVEKYDNVKALLDATDTSNLSEYDQATLHYYYADYYHKTDRQDLAYQSAVKSKNLFLSLQKLKDAVDCNILILGILSYLNSHIDTDPIINETENFALEYGDSIALRTVYRRIGAKYIHLEKGEEAIKHFKKIIPIALKLGDTIRVGYSYENIATSFKYTKPVRLDSAIYYNNKATEYYIRFEDFNTLSYNYNNKGLLLKSLEDYDKAIGYFIKADSIVAPKNRLSDKILFYQNLSEVYALKKDFAKAYSFLEKNLQYQDSLNRIDQLIAIERFDNQSLRADNLISEAERKQNQLLLLISIIVILVGSAISYLQLKSSRRKRLLAFQEKELEQQKNLTLLKEQEITTINAMVEGQEKERKRVAEDLHDNLGSVVATLKLHFDNLRINREKKKINQETLFDKTENLIDEAYQKVRSIAHAKNAGVIANQGLLVAVKLMAEKISSANSVQIEVIDYGLEKPIENALEIALFRIIQELTTNIIKHAKASMATINISQDSDDITILIEDNGIGMDSSQINIQKGMGLHSIKTRVEHLEGSFTVDSTPSKGTTIVINIPS